MKSAFLDATEIELKGWTEGSITENKKRLLNWLLRNYSILCNALATQYQNMEYQKLCDEIKS